LKHHYKRKEKLGMTMGLVGDRFYLRRPRDWSRNFRKWGQACLS